MQEFNLNMDSMPSKELCQVEVGAKKQQFSKFIMFIIFFIDSQSLMGLLCLTSAAALGPVLGQLSTSSFSVPSASFRPLSLISLFWSLVPICTNTYHASLLKDPGHDLGLVGEGGEVHFGGSDARLVLLQPLRAPNRALIRRLQLIRHRLLHVYIFSVLTIGTSVWRSRKNVLLYE